MIFSKRKSIGTSGQDILINFLSQHFGYSFLAGERNEKIVNPEIIEELEGCEYVLPKTTYPNSSGAKLKFVRDEKEYLLTCPDLFMSRNNTEKHYWIEVKTHTKNDTRIIIDKDNFDDYATLYTKFTRQNFYVMCWNPINENFWNVYWCEFGKLLSKIPIRQTLGNNSVYVWEMSDVMVKLNRYPINIKNYV